MRVLATADLHGSLPQIKECDVLLVGGDVCPDHPIGKRARYSLPDNGSDYQLEWLDGPFRTWLADLGARGISVVGIAGNHDFVFERMATAVRELYLPWTYLQDSATTIKGMRVWGTPWVPGLPRWAFYGSEQALQARSEMIPEDIDVLLTHGPPYGVADFVAPQFGSTHVGDGSLNLAIERVKPDAVVCGHIHEQYGIHKGPGRCARLQRRAHGRVVRPAAPRRDRVGRVHLERREARSRSAFALVAGPLSDWLPPPSPPDERSVPQGGEVAEGESNPPLWLMRPAWSPDHLTAS